MFKKKREQNSTGLFLGKGIVQAYRLLIQTIEPIGKN